MSQHNYPDAVAPIAPQRGNEIRAGEQQVVAMGIEIDCGRWGGAATEEFYLRQFVNWFTEHEDAETLEISIDAAIFDDGVLLGPNKSELDQHYKSYVDAKQGFYRIIMEALDSGMSLDEAFAPIEAIARANTVERAGFERRKHHVEKNRGSRSTSLAGQIRIPGCAADLPLRTAKGALRGSRRH